MSKIDTVYSMIEHSSLEENLELIGNLLIRVGADYLNTTSVEGGYITQDQLIELVMQDRETNGETIANATVLQGLTLLTWLKRGPK